MAQSILESAEVLKQKQHILDGIKIREMRELILTKEIPIAELESNKLKFTKVLKENQILDDVQIRELRELHNKLESTQDLTRKRQMDTASIRELRKSISAKEMTIAELQNK